MLEEGGLSFSSAVVLVVGVLLGQLILFAVVRRKWRMAVARREEVKMLLAFAAEEAARAELEVAAAYVYENGNSCNCTYVSALESQSEPVSMPVQYQCAVCFSPTTTRCARCKSVRYCSGKCQIIHWRQGHKEECHPFTPTPKISGIENFSGEKMIKDEEYNTDSGMPEFEARKYVKLVETLSGEPSNSSSEPCEVQDKEFKFGVKVLTEQKGTSPPSKFTTYPEGFSASSAPNESSIAASSNNIKRYDILDPQESADVVRHKSETDCAEIGKTRAQVPNQSDVDKSVDGLTFSHSCNKKKPKSVDEDVFCGSTGSSTSSADDVNELSYFKPATPSPDFCEGTIDSRRLRVDAHDDPALSSSNDESGNGNMSNPQSSFSYDSVKDTVPSADMMCYRTMVNTLDDTHLTAARIDKPTKEARLSEGIRQDAQMHKKSPSSTCETSNMDIRSCYSKESRLSEGIRQDAQKQKKSLSSCETSNMDIKACYSRYSCGEVRCCSSGSPCAFPVSGGGGHPTSENVLRVCGSSSLRNDGSNHVVNNNPSVSLTSGVRKVGPSTSQVSEAYFSSSTGLPSSSPGMHSVESGKCMKVERFDGVAPSSSQVGVFPQNPRNGLKTSVRKVVDHLKASKLPRHYLIGAGSDTAARYSGKGLFSYELFVKLYNWNQVELRPCGLINCGNSCYANAVLQCLASTPPLTAYLLQGLHSKACGKKQWCFTCEFETLVLKAKEGNSPVSPMGILSQIHTIGGHLGNGREEDAHEFLRYAIDAMQATCLKEAGGNSSGLEEETSLIGLTFAGYLRSKIKCMRCGGKSERHERMMDLTVEIEGDIGTLEEALHQFTGTETLDGENKYECSRCKSYEKAKKKLTIMEAPNILTIALKRFQSGKFGKLNKLIQFPEILDMAPFVSGSSDKSPIYRLYGVVVHLDIMNAAFFGHYVCYVKNVQNKWFKIDDSMVNAVELETVLKKGAYILLYARCSPRAPRLVRNVMMRRDVNKLNSTMNLRFCQVRPHSGPAYHLNGHMDIERLHGDDENDCPIQTILEEDSSSDHSSSFFSEGGSCSTDSSNIDSASMFGDLGHNWNRHWRTSSDSDTSSSSSSSSPPPCTMYVEHSPLGELENKYPVNNGSQIDDDGFWARSVNKSSKVELPKGKGSSSFLYPNSNKQHGKVASSCTCRETSSDRLGWANPFNHLKSSVPFRRSRD